METPDHDESKPRGRWPTYLAIVLALLLVVYPLSVGPASIPVNHDLNAEYTRWFFQVYRPLIALALYTDNVDVLNTYMGWWEDIP